jgi:hypothetical protein
MHYYDTDSLRFKAELNERFGKITGVHQNKNINKDKGDTTMNEENKGLINAEADAIAHKVVENTLHKMAKQCAEDCSSPTDLIAYTIAAKSVLEQTTFDVHIIIRPREDGMHIKTSIKGHVSSGHSDDDEV